MIEARFKEMTAKEKTVYLIEKSNHISNPTWCGDPSPLWFDFELISFIFKEGGKWIAVDNRTGDCWVEQFFSKKKALEYIS